MVSKIPRVSYPNVVTDDEAGKLSLLEMISTMTD